MKKQLQRTASFALTSALFCSCMVLGLPQQAARAATKAPPLSARIADPSVRFEANAGQTDPTVRFVGRGAGYGLFLTDRGAVISLPEGDGKSSRAIRMRFDADGKIAGEQPLASRSTYFTGRGALESSQFGRVRYTAVAPGVDAVFYGAGSSLEYDLEVAPGASPESFRMVVDGVDALRVEANGDLVMTTGGLEMRHRAPRAHQVKNGMTMPIASWYRIDGHVISFAVGAYERTLPLTIDPVLNYSTYLGGTNFDSVNAMAVDNTGSVYVVGSTASPDFPTQFGLLIPNRNRDAFVSKLSPAGSVLVYSSYLGGSDNDDGVAMALGADGSVYVAGITRSADFPTAGGAYVSRGTDDDVFYAKISANGQSLLVSGAFGGAGIDDVGGIAIDGSGAIHLTGATNSADFPTQLPLQISSGGGDRDVFVTKLNAAATGLAFSTYLGASGRDDGAGIVVDSAGNVIVTGFTNSTAFPTRRALQVANAGGRDAFVTSINPTGTEINFSTFYGGTFNDVATAIALGPGGEIFLTGQTFSDDFPTLSSLNPNTGNGDAFVVELNSAASAILFGTFLGGSAEDRGNAIDVDGLGAAYVTGFTASNNFPTQLPLQTETGDANEDAFVTKINASGTRLAYSTYFGGNDADRGNAIAVDGSGNAYIGGITLSTNLPTQGPILTDRGVEDGFVAKIGNAFSDLGITLTAAPEPVASGQSLTYTITVTNTGPDIAGNVLVTFDTPAGTTFATASSIVGTITAPAAGGTGTVTLDAGQMAATVSVILTVVVHVTAGTGATIDATATVTTTATDTNVANNSASVSSTVTAPINPPIITSTTKLNNPFRVRLDGSNFQPGIQIFIGSDVTPWPFFKYKDATRVTIKGDGLKAKFPKGVPVTIRVLNPDGGEASTSLTR